MESLISQIPDFAKDIKLNLSSVLSEDGAPGLNEKQIFAIALTCAFATGHDGVITHINDATSGILTDTEKEGAKKAATIMAMNNIYYRFLHYTEDEEVLKLPAKLRMNAIANPGVAKVDFELYCLAASAINGCGKCMKSHANELKKNNVSAVGIQSAIRVASVIHALKQVLIIAR